MSVCCHETRQKLICGEIVMVCKGVYHCPILMTSPSSTIVIVEVTCISLIPQPTSEIRNSSDSFSFRSSTVSFTASNHHLNVGRDPTVIRFFLRISIIQLGNECQQNVL